MYKQVETHSESVLVTQGGREIVVHPIATLADEYGGLFHIIEDDRCYQLLCATPMKKRKEGQTNLCYHWFPEAIDVLKTLPTPEYPSPARG